MRSDRIRSERDPAAILTFEQHAKRYGDLPMPIALVARDGAVVQRLPGPWNNKINIITPLALSP
jgi:hypothetical protein